ncbi:TPA: ABC transporter ATP-binding protein [Enterobacter roggenkampii]|uniref:ABC-type dipeptide transporter n=1 Tax=Enterobacter roggenkampii TaxID=1812935 RepID=A0ABD7KLS8_9ENTR|nr:ABC transporter ATP-binding protein [Enterobacter roggenkampii]SAB18532.1 oligopeptide/dipeptide ABC transporter%2C ATP-binding protein%2C C-terminal domain [Enterobacter roggenkampii]SAC97688.1 oligopeptide/dipeptide ABC transporter%2C ATP-binding protein%2C C-terminal domain [Enterobacter roggenkampii]
MTTIPFKDATPVLQVKNLNVTFAGSPVSVLDGISLTVRAGETLALVGESGCGKSITSLALMGLLPASARIVSGEMQFRRHDLRKLSPREYADLRGSELAMIFQEPMTSLNPAFTLGDQLSEAIMRHQDVSRAEAMKIALQILEKVQIPAPEMRLKAYPHQLSGGMRQRVMIAMALINHPKLLIADEPTTALDVTIQAQILALLNTLKEETGTAVLMITHDLGVVAEVAQQVAVMYAGQVVEQGSVEAIFADPQHPYTIGLMGSIPSLSARKGPLSTIPGSVPLPESMPQGCRFATRCPFAQSRCHDEKPPLATLGAGHRVACFRVPLEHHIALGETA